MSDFKHVDDGTELQITAGPNYACIETIDDDGLHHVHLRELGLRRAAAQALAGDEWRVVSASPVDDKFIAVQRDEYERLKQAASIPDWERELLVGQAAQEEIDQLKRDYDKLEKQLRAAQPDRPEPIDPADVKVGDVVEVEADDGNWLVRGRVDAHGINDATGQLLLLPGPGWTEAHSDVATVRLVRRPAPEPDPEQVEALAGELASAADVSTFVASTVAVPMGQHWNRLARELVRRGVRVGGQP